MSPLILERVDGRGGDTEKEKHTCERDTSIGCFPHMLWLGPGIKPAAEVYALGRNGSRTLESAGRRSIH